MDNTQKPPIPPDLGAGVCITFDIDKKSSQYRARIHDGNNKSTFSDTHRGSYGEALAKVIAKWRKLNTSIRVARHFQDVTRRV